MQGYKGYKIAIWVLSLAVLIETVLLIYLWIARPKKIAKPPTIRGKIAIVIDDWGYNTNNLETLGQIRYPLTAAILPNLSYSRAISEELSKIGLEIILHLPMEPQEKFRLEKNTIMTSMNEAQIVNIIAQDLSSVLNAKGVSNHMGSLATQDTGTMEIIFNELKRRHLYFLDSLVSSRTVCFSLAKKLHLGFAKRDVFLDNKEDPEYIRGQIYKLKTRARLCGKAIGVCHDRRTSLEVLKEIMPELEKEGYKFVFISELIKQKL